MSEATVKFEAWSECAMQVLTEIESKVYRGNFGARDFCGLFGEYVKWDYI